MLPTIEITYKYSDKHQQEEWISTGKTARKSNTLVLSADQFTSDQRAVFVEFWKTIKATNVNKIELCRYQHNGFWMNTVGRFALELDADPTPEQIIDHIKAMIEQYRTADAEVKATDAAKAETKREQALIDRQALAERNALQMRLEAEKEEKRKTETAEKLGWIAQHGSERLKKGIADGFPMSDLYTEERAAFEYPGFDLDRLDCNETPDSPSEEALTLFEETQAAHPHAKIYLVIRNDFDEAVQVDDPRFNKYLYKNI